MPQSQIRTLALHAPTGIVARGLAAFAAAVLRRRDRRQLGHLDAHLLRDIGLDPEDARAECAKPFWRS